MTRTLVLIQSDNGVWTFIDGDRMSGMLQSDEALGMVAIALMTGRGGYPLASFEECEAAIFDQRRERAQEPTVNTAEDAAMSNDSKPVKLKFKDCYFAPETSNAVYLDGCTSAPHETAAERLARWAQAPAIWSNLDMRTMAALSAVVEQAWISARDTDGDLEQRLRELDAAMGTKS